MTTYLITGSCGTIGSAFVKSLSNQYPESIVRCVDNNERLLYFQEREYSNNQKVEVFLADVRDLDRLNSVMEGVDIVLHAAALKHVSMCEYSPMEAVQTNILGVNNVIRSAILVAAKKVIFMSSDKAVNPTNVLGTSKLMGERLITAANITDKGKTTIFSSVRFGNVLGSSGSVVPVFEEQIKGGGPVTLTDQKMTRFIMSVEQTIQLVQKALEISRGGEVFVTKMPAIRIKDLAEVMIQKLGPRSVGGHERIDIDEIGSQRGEKLFEELMSKEEAKRAIELDDFFMILPAFHEFYSQIIDGYDNGVGKSAGGNRYVSKGGPYLSKQDLVCFLSANKVF